MIGHEHLANPANTCHILWHFTLTPGCADPLVLVEVMDQRKEVAQEEKFGSIYFKSIKPWFVPDIAIFPLEAGHRK